MAYLLPDAKDPAASKEYTWDWSRYLVGGEVITTTSVTVSAGITLGPVQNDGQHVTAWISGGEAGQAYLLTCHITTSSSPAREDERGMILRCEDDI